MIDDCLDGEAGSDDLVGFGDRRLAGEPLGVQDGQRARAEILEQRDPLLFGVIDDAQGVLAIWNDIRDGRTGEFESWFDEAGTQPE